MRRIAIVAPPGARRAGLAVLLDLCVMANRYAAELYDLREPTLAISTTVLSVDGRPVRTSDGRSIEVDGAVGGAARYDGVYVAAVEEGQTALPPEAPLHAWLAAQHLGGAWIAAAESAIFFVAGARLLVHGRCAAPWRLEAAFRRRFKNLTLDVGGPVVEWNRILTSGAVGFEPVLALQLIEAACAPNLADVLAKLSRIAEAGAPDLVALSSGPDRLAARARDMIQRNFTHDVDLRHVAADLGVSPRTLLRRFRTAFGLTPIAYLQGRRVESAKQMLARSTRPIDRVAYLVGYADSGFFKEVFRRREGITPAEFRRRAQRPASSRTPGAAYPSKPVSEP